MRHRALDTGTVGMAHPPFNSVPFLSSTMTSFTPAIGPTMFPTVRSIVSISSSTGVSVCNSASLSPVAICKDAANGAVAIEKSCVRYWLCVGGYPRLQRCPAGLAFNANVLRCELAQTVPGCEPPPTTPATEEDSAAEDESPVSSSPGVTASPSNGRSLRPQLSQPSLVQSQPQGPLPQPFRPSQPGVRLVG